MDPSSDHDRRLLTMLLTVMDDVLASLNATENPARDARRVSEVSRAFEDAIAARIDRLPDWSCHPPVNAAGNTQRSGYPDLEIRDLTTGTITYLDPKLYAASSESSTFRTFYFEPRTDTAKITQDARHFACGHRARHRRRRPTRVHRLKDRGPCPTDRPAESRIPGFQSRSLRDPPRWPRAASPAAGRLPAPRFPHPAGK